MPIDSKRANAAIRVLQQAGFRGDRLRTAFAIVMRESGGNPQAHNPNRATGDDSYGLAQINMLGSMGPARRRQFGLRSNEDLFDPQVNARAMYQLSKGGSDFGAWGIGPNAYRKGAGFDTIRRFYNEFPGPTTDTGVDVEAPAVAPAAPAAPAAPGGNRLAAALALIAASRARRGAAPSMLFRALQQRAAEPAPPAAVSVMPEAPVEPAGPGLMLPAAFKGTHVTSGLDWSGGRPTAVDIMARPGTPVLSPVDGRVVRWGSAQGGEALYIDDDDPDSEPDYWLGHVDSRLPVGARVRKGRPVARVSRDHPRPHAHWDRRA